MSHARVFAGMGLFPDAEKWNQSIARNSLYNRSDDVRSPFARDYTRILHCTAYRRLKHKTQVFFDTKNDHVCTRIEHVNHVNSISKTIAMELGLNSELTDAISIGHDLGHAPFGHKGEQVLNKIAVDNGNAIFWHEGNSLRFVDKIEILDSPTNKFKNLDLTYAVRDGILCHCGEIDEPMLSPRTCAVPLESICKSDKLFPYTWEGCVVKIADKIAYLGRDIEDALVLGVLCRDDKSKLFQIINKYIKDEVCLNNTVLIHSLVVDLCKNSNPDNGIKLSESHYALMCEVKEFCYTHIYRNEKVEIYKRFVDLVIRTLYEVLFPMISEWSNMDCDTKFKKYYPSLSLEFFDYIRKYSVQHCCDNEYGEIKKIYDLEMVEDRTQACIDFISGMTDKYAIRMFKDIISF